MKLPVVLVSQTALVLGCLGVAGCASKSIERPEGQGFEEVSHTGRSNLSESGHPRVSFDYKGADGKTLLIWPSLYGVGEVIHGKEAIFVGDLASGSRSQADTPRLFAVEPPALPLDITDFVLWRWAKITHHDFNDAVNNFTVATPEETDTGVKIDLEFWSADDAHWPDKATITLDWRQLDEITRAVKQRGFMRSDGHWHTPYLGN